MSSRYVGGREKVMVVQAIRVVLFLIIAVGVAFMVFAAGWSGTFAFAVVTSVAVLCGWIASKMSPE